jgi:integrase
MKDKQRKTDAEIKEKLSRGVSVYGRQFYIFKRKGFDDYHIKFAPPPDVRAALSIETVFKSTRSAQRGTALQIARGIIEDHFPDPRDPLRKVRAVDQAQKIAEADFALLPLFIERYRIGARTVRDKQNVRQRTLRDNVAQLKSVLERRWDAKGKELPRRVGAHAKMTIDKVVDPELWNAFMDGWLRSVKRNDPNALERAKVSVNATIAHARSMFGDEYLPLYKGLRVPDLTRFRKDVRFLKVDPAYMKFEAIPSQTIDALESEIRSLRGTRPDLYLGYFLAVRCGMRRSEIANARHEWIETWVSGEPVITIKPRSYFMPKRSARAVGIEPWLLQEVLEVGGAKQPLDFLLPGTSKTAIWKAMKYDLSRIIRKHLGPDRSHTLHELRGQAGSLIAAEYGLEEAMRFLGHTDMRTTLRHYVDFVKAPKTLRSSKPLLRALPDPEVAAAATA